MDGAGTPTQSTDEATDEATMVAEPVYCPGGSAANVMKGIANLGGESAFVGMIGKDEVGRRYRELLAAQNVRPAGGTPTLTARVKVAFTRSTPVFSKAPSQRSTTNGATVCTTCSRARLYRSRAA